jgi:hypothetical protein
MNPNGVWTLFFADVSGGGGTSQVNSWSLDLTAVPEPVNVALGVFGAVFISFGLIKQLRSRPGLRTIQSARSERGLDLLKFFLNFLTFLGLSLLRSVDAVWQMGSYILGEERRPARQPVPTNSSCIEEGS